MYLPSPQPLQRALPFPSSATKVGLAAICELHDLPHPWSHLTELGDRGTQLLASGMLWHRKLFSSKNNLGQMLILGDVDMKINKQREQILKRCLSVNVWAMV